MKKNMLCFPLSENSKVELNALCANNIKMMILDMTKKPDHHLSPAIRALCDDVYEWQRNEHEYAEMQFNLTFDVDKRFNFAARHYLVDVRLVNTVTSYYALFSDSVVSKLIKLGNNLALGLQREYEQRDTVPKNIYWEELYTTNSLLMDLLPNRVVMALFERDVEYSTGFEFLTPQVGYLRLVHNAMAWITLWNSFEAVDLKCESPDYILGRTLCHQLTTLLETLWEPIDSLRIYVQNYSRQTRDWLISTFRLW